MDRHLSLLSSATTSAGLLSLSLSALHLSETKVKGSILSGKTHIPSLPLCDLPTLIHQLSPPQPDRIAVKHQLSAYKKREEELSSKVQFLNQEISILQELTDISEKPNKKGEEISEQERMKFIEKMRKQRLEISKNRFQSLQKRQITLEIEDKSHKDRLIQAHFNSLSQQKAALKARITAAQLKREEQKKWKAETDRNLRKVMEKPPLCEILELSFDSKRHIEFIRSQEELKTRKNDLYSPMNKKEIDKFAAVYMENKRKRQEEKREKLKEERLNLRYENSMKALYRPKIADFLEEETERSKSDRISVVNSTKNRQIKRKIYSQTVKSLFSPSTDQRKSDEMSHLRLKALNPRIPSSISAKELIFLESAERRKLWELKKQTSKTRLPPLQVKPYYDTSETKSVPISPKTCDYLKERQNARQQVTEALMTSLPDVKSLSKSILPDNPKHAKSLLKLLSKAENIALRQEHLISEGSPSQPRLLEYQSEISQVFIDSIKAKLEIINAL